MSNVTPEQFKNRANLKIRTDRENGVVAARMTFVVDGETLKDDIDIACVNISILDVDRGVYDAFVSFATIAMKAILKDIESQHKGKVSFDDTIHKAKPKDMN